MQDPPGPAGSGTVQDGAGGVQAQQPCIKTSTWKHSQGGCGKRKEEERKGSQQSLMDFFFFLGLLQFGCSGRSVHSSCLAAAGVLRMVFQEVLSTYFSATKTQQKHGPVLLLILPERSPVLPPSRSSHPARPGSPLCNAWASISCRTTPASVSVSLAEARG